MSNSIEIKYDEQNCIGSGVFGEVYPSYDGKYAFKVIKAAEVWEDEIKFLGMVQGHPNIVKMFTAVKLEKSWVVVLEKAESNLVNYRSTKQVEDIDVKGLGKQLFQGLEYIHLKKLIHSDIKGENILVYPLKEGGKRVSICDFGNAYFFTDDNTEPNVTTISYRAPELLAMQKTWDEKIDIWSMGNVYYYILKGSTFMNIYEPLLCLRYITFTYGYLQFENPPLPFLSYYWNKDKFYHRESASSLLKLEPNEVIDASMTPLPSLRKSASEIVKLFN